MSLRIFLVDDEPLARQRIIRLLNECDGYDVVAEADNGHQALDWLSQFKNKADVVLLDIEMPGLTGLKVAQQLSTTYRDDDNPAIIFCTAYDEYALNAFKVDAVDYLLKPIRKEELVKALEKARRLAHSQDKQQVQQPVSQEVKKAVKSESEENNKNKNSLSSAHVRDHISVRTHQGLQLIAIEDIYSFRAEQKYVVVTYRTDDTSINEVLIDESLKMLESEFEEGFVRIHRSAMVAKDKIERLESVGITGHLLYLKGIKEGVSVSRRHLPSVRKFMRAP